MGGGPVNRLEEAIAAAAAAIFNDNALWVSFADNPLAKTLGGPREARLLAAKIAVEAAAPILREAGEEVEWGVRWHSRDVRHGHGGDGAPPYNERSARETAGKYENAEAVYRVVAGPWIAAP